MTVEQEGIWRDLKPTRESGPVDRQAFEQEIFAAHRPIILRGQTEAWPIVEAGRAGPERFLSYLRRHATSQTAELWLGVPELDGRFRYQPDFKGLNFERRLATIPQICDLLAHCQTEAEPPSLFAGAIYLPDVMPGIVPELPMPLLRDDQDRLTSLWIGNRSRTAAHYDRPHNLACVVSGERRFLLFPTDQIRNLYIGPVDFTIAGQAISLVDCENPDFERFPKYREALDNAEIAVLQPGDVLYIPPLWWHYVSSPNAVSGLVNFWWTDEPANRLAATDSLMHAMLTLRNLSPAERAGWKAIFDYYIFDSSSHDVSHIPPAGRGVLGDLNDAQRARLRQFLAEHLNQRS